MVKFSRPEMRSRTFSNLSTCPLAKVQSTKRCRPRERLKPLLSCRIPRYAGCTGRRRCPIYKVLIDDNFHYQDEDERVAHGAFGTREEALAACRRIVDEFLGRVQARHVSGAADGARRRHDGRSRCA